jgi:hypothetical protein
MIRVGTAGSTIPCNCSQKPDDELILLEANSETKALQEELVEGYLSFNWHHGEKPHWSFTESRIIAYQLGFQKNSWSSLNCGNC